MAFLSNISKSSKKSADPQSMASGEAAKYDLRKIRCDLDSVETVDLAMKALFPKLDETLRRDYANCVCLLSDPEACQAALTYLNYAVGKSFNILLDESLPNSALLSRIKGDNLVFGRLNCNATPQGPCTQHWAHLSVSKVLKHCFKELGVTGLKTDLPCAVFPNAQSQSFFDVARTGVLFVDGVNAGHGEFTHTIQWLILASARCLSGLKCLDSFMCKNDIGTLYMEATKESGKSVSNLFFEGAGQLKFEPKYVWDFVLDCFLLTDKQRTENNMLDGKCTKELGVSLFADNMRSPRFLQYALFGFAGEDRFKPALKHSVFEVDKVHDACPLLCEMLKSRHRHKNLTIDMDEKLFHRLYGDRAKAKFEKYEKLKFGGLTFTPMFDEKNRTFYPIPKPGKYSPN
jgi:hypothetical protein